MGKKLQTILSVATLTISTCTLFNIQKKFQEVLDAMDLTKKQLLDAVNNSTNEIATAQLALVVEIDNVGNRVAALIAKANDEGLSPEEQAEADELLKKLATVSTGITDQAKRLQGIAADPDNPVPPVPTSAVDTGDIGGKQSADVGDEVPGESPTQ